MKKLFFSICILTSTCLLWATYYHVHSFSIEADGNTLNTRSIQKAIDLISERGGGRLLFSAGHYLTGSIYLKSNVTLHLEEGATLLGSTNPFDYVKDPYIKWMSMIFAVKQTNIGITGKGTITVRGFFTANNMVNYINRGLYSYELNYDRQNETKRTLNIHFTSCENGPHTGITLRVPDSWSET